MNENQKNIFWVIFLTLAILGNIYFSFNVKSHVVTVTGTGSSGGIYSKPLVYAENETDYYVFENTNNWIRLKLNKTDIQHSLKEGSTYRIKTVGIYFPTFNHYPNVIEVKKIN